MAGVEFEADLHMPADRKQGRPPPTCTVLLRPNTSAAKDEFLHDLELALSAVPPNEPYILLRDLNARVGSRDGTDDPWSRVRGPHGYGLANDAGEELLMFLSMMEPTVCNTWFKKRNRPGSTLNVSSGTALIMPSCARRIDADASTL